MHIHKLQRTTHEGFLAEKRIDPITGEPILAGDEIVICAACKSAFLRETWEYLGRKHCGQHQTAIKLPQMNLLSLKKRHLLGALIYQSPKVRVERKLPIFFKGIRIGIIVIWGIFVILNFFQDLLINFTYSLFTIVFCLTMVFTLIEKFTHLTQIPKNKFSIREQGIVFFDGELKSYTFDQIEALHLRVDAWKELSLDKSSPDSTILLRVTLKTAHTTWIGLSENPMDFRKISRTIFELHEKVAVSFTVQDAGDYKRLTRMAREVEKAIEVIQV